MLDKMEKIEDPAITFNDAASLSIRFPDPGPLPKNELIQFDGLAFAYPGKTPLFQKATANLDIKGRIGILGANGVSWNGRIMKDHMRERERWCEELWPVWLIYDLYDLFALQAFQPRPGRVHCWKWCKRSCFQLLGRSRWIEMPE